MTAKDAEQYPWPSIHNNKSDVVTPDVAKKATKRRRQVLRIVRCNMPIRFPTGELIRCQEEQFHEGDCVERGTIEYDNGTAAQYEIKWHDLGIHETRKHK